MASSTTRTFHVQTSLLLVNLTVLSVKIILVPGAPSHVLMDSVLGKHVPTVQVTPSRGESTSVDAGVGQSRIGNSTRIDSSRLHQVDEAKSGVAATLLELLTLFVLALI
ncbi:hypothetical protein FB451DRAFT_1179100 [Mycena latifolia]|nr:hypothetical protein FB451DRAFT_1179100 [Mycena latifolia]